MKNKKPLIVLYISGLGDKYDGFRAAALKTWRLWGVETELIPMQWNDGSTYEVKWARIKEAVYKAKQSGSRVAVIGESAGGTMAVRAGADLRLDCMVTISGVTSPATPISPMIFAKSPAFKESLRLLPKFLDKLKTANQPALRFIGWLDTVVPPTKNQLPNARTVRLPSLGHIATNVIGLTIFSGLIVYYIRGVVKRLPDIPTGN